MRKKYWETANGEEVAYEKLEDNHLLNILRFIEKKAEEGITLSYGGGAWDIDDLWFEEEHLSGQKVKDHFDFKNLAKEALKRGILSEKEYLLRV